MRLFTHAESGQLTYTPLSLDTAKHSRYILSTSLYTKRKTPPPLWMGHGPPPPVVVGLWWGSACF